MAKKKPKRSYTTTTLDSSGYIEGGGVRALPHNLWVDIKCNKVLYVCLTFILGQHRTIAEASAVESPIRQETIGFPAHFFARAHNFKPPGRACQPEADSPMRT